MELFRNLSNDEETEFKAWAREHYTAGEPISDLWHPIVQEECEKINQEAETGNNQPS